MNTSDNINTMNINTITDNINTMNFNTDNDIVWLSIDPVKCKIDYYPKMMHSMNQTKINELLVIDGKKSSNINYPLSHLIYELDDGSGIVIVVYNVAIGSLYDIKKIFDRKFTSDEICKFIPQMIKSINFIHECGYTHTDIKPENFLISGINRFQHNL